MKSEPAPALNATPLSRTAARLSNDTGQHLAWAGALKDQVLRVEEARTIENTLEPLNEMWMHLEAVHSECELLANVHPNDAVRGEAKKSVQAAAEFITKVNLDRDLYEAYQAVDLGNADPATRFMVENVLRHFRREGVDADDQTRDRITELNNEIVGLGQEFKRTIREDRRTIKVDSREGLAGLPEDWKDRHEPGPDGKIEISTDNRDYQAFRTYAENADARLALYRQFYDRGYPDNLDTLTKLIRKRHEKARLLGYSSWADYITEDKMIESAANAQSFIDRIAVALHPAAQRDMAVLLDRKRKDEAGATAVEEWEWHYYENLVRQERFGVDPQIVREYFDFPTVRRGLFEITSKMFGIEYRQVRGLDLWHEDVTAWDIYEEGKVIGRFYLDLHPRDNKYKHAACFGYREGVAGKQIPQAALVCNFPKPTGKPGSALMEHAQVVTFFHEFGHLLHALLGGHQRWIKNSGIPKDEWDFAEVPPQMLEEWAVSYDALKLFARHYATGETIPAELVENMRQARDFGKGLHWARQLFYTSMSLDFYNCDPATLNTTDRMVELHHRYSPFPYVDSVHYQCNFGHLDHYSAIYYTYIWSKVIARDLLSEFEKNGMFDAETARRYRSAIIEPGGSKNAAEMVRGFLGRDFSFDAFETWLKRS